MTQVYQCATSVHENFQTLATYNTSLAAASSAAGDSSGSGLSSGSSSRNLNVGVTIGLGVGLSLGVPLACGAMCWPTSSSGGSGSGRGKRQEARGSHVIFQRRSKVPILAHERFLGLPRSVPEILARGRVWVDKTTIEYYADGAGPGARYNRQPLGELDVAGSADPIHELGSGSSSKHESCRRAAF